MEYRKFVVPSDAEILDVLGVLPEVVEDDPTVRSFRLASKLGGEALFSYDVPGRSFRVQISSDGVKSLDVLREAATRLSVSIEDENLRVLVTFESSDLAGELVVLVGSEIFVQDKLLMI